MPDDQQRPGPHEYRDIFEVDRRGAAIYEDLVKRFARPQVSTGGVDAILKTYENGGMRKVIEYITLMINRANGLPDANEEDNT